MIQKTRAQGNDMIKIDIDKSYVIQTYYTSYHIQCNMLYASKWSAG